MQAVILTVKIQTQRNLVVLRHRCRQVSDLFGLEALQRTRLTTAVSEIGRNGLLYAGAATASFRFGDSTAAAGAQSVTVVVTDQGPGIPAEAWEHGEAGRGGGLRGSQRLVDVFSVETRPGVGSTVSLEMLLPRSTPRLAPADVGQRIDALVRRQPQNDFEELEQQNRDMLQTLEELRQRKSELELADQRKNEFVAMLAHELRNPLAVIAMSIAVMRRKQNLGPEQIEKYRDTIGRQTAQLTRLVDDLVDVSRVSRGKVDLKRGVIEVGALLFEAVEMTRAHVDAKGHRLLVHPAAAPCWVDVDMVRMKQVISNLLHNAARYTPDGGLIEVDVATTRTTVDIRIKDDGIGIDAAMLPRIFDLFTQGPGDLAREDVGLGIGLTIVQRLAADHGGSVTARSAGLGQGSEFVLTLPLANPPAAAATVAAPAASGAGRVTLPRLLLVEDNPDALETLAELCRLNGYACDLASDGLQGLAAAEALRPDIAVVDIGLPGLDGFALARALRQARGDGLRLVAMSGYSAPETLVRATQAGFDAFLVKPVEMHALLAVLDPLRPAPPTP